jgi:NAD(P)-dependent dehydrogenase (short-subunit alcohol dehydrogenase family)
VASRLKTHSIAHYYPAVTGANRGIGLELVKAYSSDSKNIIIAGVRDPSSATALHELSKTAAAKIHITKIDSADEAGNRAAAKEIEEVFGRVDVLWANAGGFEGFV